MNRFARPFFLAAAVVLCCSAARTEAPAAGDRIAVGPYQVQMAEQGGGRYAVIVESGFGEDLRTWRKVAPEVAKSARAVTYSRAGYGTSEPRPEPRTILESSRELDQLVAGAKLRPP